MTLAIVMIFMIPIGVPLVFFMLMMKAKSQLPNSQPNTTVLGGAKLCVADLNDDQDQYGFLCRDLKPAYWYYEIVVCKYTNDLLHATLGTFSDSSLAV